MRIATLNNLAVEFEHQTQNPMRRRVLRAEVNVEVADLLLAAQRVDAAVVILGVKFGAVHHCAPSFSSPGRMYSAPSHGDMKSNWRYSCTSFTGS